MKDDAGEFVASGGDRFSRAEFGPHPAVEIAEGALAVVQRLCCHTQSGRGTAVNPPQGLF